MNRRAFLQTALSLGSATALVPLVTACTEVVSAPVEPAVRGTKTAKVEPTASRPKAQVALVKSQDRTAGVTRALDLLAINPVRGKNLFLKPNFNSADTPPGSTHNDTLSTLVNRLQAMGAERITVGDRSGMGDTRAVMQAKEIFRMADELAFETVVFDDLTENDWLSQQTAGDHWKNGFAMAGPAMQADGIVQTCCLKTHRYGGHFTLSLKNSVGLVAKYIPGDSHDYMRELHSSEHQRRMIAEINAAYQPDLIILDGVEAFVEGGPDQGKQVAANVILAGTDPIAIDAVGVAILRHYGTTPAVSQGLIFQQAQLARAVELGLGVSGPDQIELITDDADSAAYAAVIRTVLDQG